MRYILITFSLLLSVHAYNQEGDPILKSVVTYANFKADKTEYVIGDIENQTIIFTDVLEFGKPSIAFRKELLNGWITELEITDLIFFKVDRNSQEVIRPETGNSQIVGGFDKRTTELGLRYEVMKPIGGSSSKKLKFLLGVSANTGFTRIALKPRISTLFFTKVIDLNFESHIIPRLTYDVSHRMRADVSVLIDWISHNAVFTNEDNPRIPRRISQRNTNDTDFFSPNAHLRVGLAMDLWKAE